MNANSAVDQSTSSSASRERCTWAIAPAARNSSPASRDATASMLLREGRGKPPRLDLVADLGEPTAQCGEVFRGEQPDTAEHLCVGPREAQVVARERAIETDRRREPLDARIGVLPEASPPGFVAFPRHGPN